MLVQRFRVEGEGEVCCDVETTYRDSGATYERTLRATRYHVT